MKFLATAELGRLCKWLRILGYDCEYRATPAEKSSTPLIHSKYSRAKSGHGKINIFSKEKMKEQQLTLF